MGATRIHWDSTTCPYAQRSWIALIEKGLDFEIRKVDLANKDSEFVEVYRSVHPDPEASAKVPILQEPDGFTLIESNVIVDYLDVKYPEKRLLPQDPQQAAIARLWVDTVSSLFTPALFAVLRAADTQGVEEGKGKLVAALTALNTFLERHGSTAGGNYLLGGTYSFAEVGTTGFVQRALTALPAYRSIDVWGLVRDNKLARLDAWMTAALDRPSAQQTKPDDQVIVDSWRKFVTPLEN